MFPEGLACSGAGVPVSHSHLELSICTGTTVPRRGPQIPSLVLVCGGKLGNTAEAETLWFWGPGTAACPTPVHMYGECCGKMVKMLPGSLHGRLGFGDHPNPVPTPFLGAEVAGRAPGTAVKRRCPGAAVCGAAVCGARWALLAPALPPFTG